MGEDFLRLLYRNFQIFILRQMIEHFLSRCFRVPEDRNEFLEPIFQYQINSKTTFWESAKLHALRAHVPLCLACIRAHVPTCLTCLRALVPTCPACSRAKVPCVLACSRAHICLACLHAHVRTCLACLRARVTTCLAFVRANVPCVLTCQRAYMLTCLACPSAHVL